MADYAQFLEGSGARVVPIIDTESDEQTLEKLSKLNGVLFPGGAPGKNYKSKAEFIYKQAIEMNDKGTYFPILGICMGFEFLNEFASDAGDHLLEKLSSHKTSITLNFTVDPSETKMFKEAGEAAKDYETEASSYQSHTWGVNPESYEKDEGLKNMFKLTSTCHDEKYDSTFACTMESDKYPFMGTQFHPEKQIYQWNDDEHYNHDWDSVKLNRFFADTFVKEAREQGNAPGDYSQVQDMIIENFDFFVTDTYYGNVYMFN